MRCSKIILTFALSVASFLFSSGIHASFFSRKAPTDPPSRVARLSYTKGDVSFSPAAAKNNVWVAGRINRPLVTGDRLWTDHHARAELQLGSAAARIEDETSLRIINLNDQMAQLDLSQGSLILHVRQIKAGQTYEIDTPQLAFRITQPGIYRVDVSDKGDATLITARKGNGFAYAKNAAYQINSPHTYRFAGKKLQVQATTLPALDSFDKWSQDRETRATKSKSVKYVSTNMIGYEDLDNYGNWRHTTEYGYVWTPNRVPTNWAPYRYGHWSWIDPWGWTWVDDQPWGFAPSHYGRWAHYHNTWVWIPGTRTAQATYAPALVVFIGGNKHSITVNANPGIAWFPLGPHDVYIPPYTTSETYFNNVNISNTTVTQVQITQIYHNRTTQTHYSNYQINNAITAVPTKSFIQSEPTNKVVVPITTTVVNQAPITTTATVTPAQTSVTGTQVTTSKPDDSTLERIPVVVTTPPTSTTPVVQVTPTTEAIIPATSTGTQVESAPPITGTYHGGEAEATTSKDTNNIATEKAEADKKADSEKAEAEKATAEQQAAAKAEAERAATEQQAAAKAEAERAAAEQQVAAKAEAERAAAEQQAAAKVEAERAAAEQQAAAKAEAERAAAEQQAAAKAEAERAAAEQQAAAKAEAERAAAEQQAAAKAEADRAAAEQQAAAKAEADRAAAEQQATPAQQ